MTRDLFISSLNPATLDLVVRAGRIFGMPIATDDDIADLENLYKILKSLDVYGFHGKGVFESAAPGTISDND